MNVLSYLPHMWHELRLWVDKARIILRTTAPTPCAKIAALVLLSDWKFPRNLAFAITFFVVTVMCSVTSWLLTVLETGPHPVFRLGLTIVLFAVLFTEIVSIVVSLGWFLLSHISLSGMEQADHLFSTLSATERTDCLGRFRNSSKEKNDKVVLGCVELVTSRYCLSASMVNRFAYFGGVWVRLWVAFATGSIALSMIQQLAVCPTAVFGTARYDISSAGIGSLIEQSFYHSLVTISTVGYGDFAPVTLAGRFLVVLQILTALAVLTFGLNILVGLILESSALAWAGRRDIVYEYLQRVSAN